jgi:hypothetical protein
MCAPLSIAETANLWADGAIGLEAFPRRALYRAWLIPDLINVRAWREADEVAGQLLERAP